MELVTRRLRLRDFVEADAPAFVAYHTDPRSAQFYAPGEAAPGSARQLLDVFRGWAIEQPRRNYQLAITLLPPQPAPRDLPADGAHAQAFASSGESGESAESVIGSIGLRGEGLVAHHAEFGLELAPAAWGQGYAAEAARAFLTFGFRDLDLTDVVGVSVSANLRVARLVRGLGFVQSGTRPGAGWMQGHGWHHVEWWLTRQAWADAGHDLSAP
jgi:RimJ/RimL family protein N-acetyltransferase